MGRGLYRTARGELKNIIAFGRHRETHRPSPRRPGTRQHHQSQGGQRQKPGPFPRRPHRHRPQLRLHRGHRPPLPVGAPAEPVSSRRTTACRGGPRAVESTAIVRHNGESHCLSGRPARRRVHRHRPPQRREPLPVGAARAPSSPPPSSATAARATACRDGPRAVESTAIVRHSGESYCLSGRPARRRVHRHRPPQRREPRPGRGGAPRRYRRMQRASPRQFHRHRVPRQRRRRHGALLPAARARTAPVLPAS